MQVLKFAQDLGLEELKVEATGCLGAAGFRTASQLACLHIVDRWLSIATYLFLPGGCGTGPNMMLTPGPIPLRHIATPAKVVEILRVLCNLDVSDTLLKVRTRLWYQHLQS